MSVSVHCLLNGEPATQVSLLDRGLHYGDGIFETLAVSQQQILLWDAHLDRLLTGCQRLKISPPDSQVLETEAKLLAKDVKKGVLKIILSRGSGGRGYMPPLKQSPSRIIALYPWPEYSQKIYSEKVSLFLCGTRCGQNSLLAGIKHLNRLEQVMARSEWQNAEYFDGVMLDTSDNVIEGTMSNIFCVANDQLFTPDLSQSGIKGIIREEIIKLARSNNIALRINSIALSELIDANEIFICNSIIGIVSVNCFQSKNYTSSRYADFFRQHLISNNMISAEI